jgi:hypothetical protein
MTGTVESGGPPHQGALTAPERECEVSSSAGGRMGRARNYRTIRSIETALQARPIKLALQERLDVPPAPFYTISWRTRYAGIRQNRRFYWVSDGTCWTVPVATARELLRAAEQKEMLDPRYDDPYDRFGSGVPTFVDSDALSSAQRRELWREISFVDRDGQWELARALSSRPSTAAAGGKS